MTYAAHQKITALHLERRAYLYVRQSSMQQVFENTESTKRQYALRQRAIALGWRADDVIVIDCDQGQSGASAADREGFQQLVTEVGLGRVGVVLGLEVSRLARNNSDWHRLLELCALGDTLILDEDGLYNPAEFNDRLLLGLKGTMSEAELHVLRARLRGGILNKARRGELKLPLPVGLVYDSSNRVILDPDKEVQHTLRHFFVTFRRTGSASATVTAFREQKLLFPHRALSGPRKGELVWGALSHSKALRILHNPRYAGAFVYGRHGERRNTRGRVTPQVLPKDEWFSLLLDAHPGYITWDDYEANVKLLLENAQAHGMERRKSPPREGPALLQGIVMCGVCGERMTVRYQCRHNQLFPLYVCQNERVHHGGRVCQSIPGATIDAAIGALLVEKVSPAVLEVALRVHEELQKRIDDVDYLLQQRVERAKYEADLCRRRFMQVDPANRLVADALEAEWNEKLRLQQQAQEQYEEQRNDARGQLSEEQRQKVLALATDFAALWHDPATSSQHRKRMVRLLIEDVALVKQKKLSVSVRFKGGATQVITLPLPQNSWQMRQTPPQIVAKIDHLLDDHTDEQIATILNNCGHLSGTGKPFTSSTIMKLRTSYGLKSRYQRLRDAGLLTMHEMSALLGVHSSTIKTWRNHGLLLAVPYNDKNECLYPDPGPNAPVKQQGTKLSERQRSTELPSNQTQEVQYEA